MASGGVAFTAATYDRVIELIDQDGTTSLGFLCNLAEDVNIVEHAEFELRRQGGCGTGSFSLAQKFGTGLIPEVGQFIICKFEVGGANWYFGRVEEVEEEFPSGIRIRTEGLFSILNDTYVGGYGEVYGRKPHLYARSNYYPNDPDRALQSWDTATYFHSVVEAIYNQYIAPTGVGLDVIEAPDEDIDFYSMVFRGSESTAEILRTLAESCYGASYGVNADGEFYFKNMPTTVAHSFTAGQHMAVLSRVTDRDLLYNYMELTGAYIYDSAGGNAAHYRYNSIWNFPASITAHGLKRIQLYLPHIRNNQESFRFAMNFFFKYSEPYARYNVQIIPQGELILPWSGMIELKDETGASLVQDIFESVKIVFDEAPYYSLTTGPDDLQYPTAPEAQQWELPAQGGGGGDAGNVPEVSYIVTGGVLTNPAETNYTTDGLVGSYGTTDTYPTDGLVGSYGTGSTNDSSGDDTGSSYDSLQTGEDPSSDNNFGCPEGTTPIELVDARGQCVIICVPNAETRPCDGPSSEGGDESSPPVTCLTCAAPLELVATGDMTGTLTGGGDPINWNGEMSGTCPDGNIGTMGITCDGGVWAAHVVGDCGDLFDEAGVVTILSCDPVHLMIHFSLCCGEFDVEITE